MRKTIYFFEYVFIKLFFTICKILGYKSSSNLGFYIGKTFGNFFRSKASIIENIRKSKILIKTSEIEFAKNVLGNYGRILAEYPFLKNFRNNDLSNYIQIDGIKNLEQIKKKKQTSCFYFRTF